MKDLILFDKKIRVDDSGFISLNDLHKASGSDPKKRPTDFLRNKNTKSFIDALNLRVEISTLRIINGGRNSGTWAHKLVCYKYAGFIDPDFEVGVYTVLDKYFSGELVTEPFNVLQEHMRKMLASEDKGSFHGKGLSQRKKEKHRLHEEGEKLLNINQTKLF